MPGPREPKVLSFSASYCPLVALVKMPSWLVVPGTAVQTPIASVLCVLLSEFTSNVFHGVASLSSLRLVTLKHNCFVTELF